MTELLDNQSHPGAPGHVPQEEGRAARRRDGRDAQPTEKAGSDEPLVRLEAVCKRFGDLVVLDELTLAIERGRTTVVLGPSGAGKSVLLKHIVGLLEPDAGVVYFDGRRVNGRGERRLAPIRREIGYLFQLSALFDSMTIAENLEFPLRERGGLSQAQRRERITEALALVDLAGAEAKLPAELSGGQQKRAALARATILRPALMLYDEPTTGLDPVRAAGINDLIVKLRNEVGVTGIVVTHDLASARAVGDRIVMLLGGKIVADGSMEQLMESPNRHVRNFLAGRYEPDLEAGRARPEQSFRTGQAGGGA